MGDRFADRRPQAGDLLGARYSVLRVVGHGGEGTVVCARDARHDRLVAVKVRDIGDDPTMLLREARTLLTLPPHRGLPTVREDVVDEHLFLIVSDWIDGTPLAHWAPHVAPATVLAALEGAADALDHLHEHGLTHGDVKPDNILVTPAGRAVLVDVGGGGATRGFLAPEVAAGEPASEAADIFSFAVTALSVLDVDGARRRSIRHGLATDPRRRPRSARELLPASVDLAPGTPALTATLLLTALN